MSNEETYRVEVDPENLRTRDDVGKAAEKIATVAHNQWHARHLGVHCLNDIFVFGPTVGTCVLSVINSSQGKLAELLLNRAEDILREMREHTTP